MFLAGSASSGMRIDPMLNGNSMYHAPGLADSVSARPQLPQTR